MSDKKEDLSLKEDIKKRLSSRKLHVVIVGFITATFFFYFGMLSGALWVDFMKWIAGIYMGANVGEWFAKKGMN